MRMASFLKSSRSDLKESEKMFYVLFSLSALLFILFFGIYALYFLLVLRNPKQKDFLTSIDTAFSKEVPPEQLPQVAILVPAHNEEKVLLKKVQNLAGINYPRQKIEVVLIDDCSTDRTPEVAREAFSKLSLNAKIIKNSEQSGVNASYNRGVSESESDLILTTDADVMLDSDALMKGVKILHSFKDAGGVTGKMIPVSGAATAAVLVEKSYRGIYDSSSTSESAIHSTFPGYTCFTLIKKSLFSPLPTDYGSSDGNISLAIIRKGQRFLSIPGISFYEPISFKVSEQRRQKVRRAARLIQSIIANKDMLFKKEYKTFGSLIFPLRFAMMILAPVLLLAAITTSLLAVAYLSTVLCLTLTLVFLFCVYAGAKIKLSWLNVLSSFVVHQFYLLVGLILSQRKATMWKPAKRSEIAGVRLDGVNPDLAR